jgi:hypothetical protein
MGFPPCKLLLHQVGTTSIQKACIYTSEFVSYFSLTLCSWWTLVTEIFRNLRRSSYKLPVSYVRSWINLNGLGRLVSKSCNIKFHKNPPNGNRVVPWRTERRIDITKLTFTFCNFVNRPKSSRLIKTALSWWTRHWQLLCPPGPAELIYQSFYVRTRTDVLSEICIWSLCVFETLDDG